jgi:hypothetical protein
MVCTFIVAASSGRPKNHRPRHSKVAPLKFLTGERFIFLSRNKRSGPSSKERDDMKTTIMVASAVLGLASGAEAQEFYMGQILKFGSSYCPDGTLPAEGDLLPIAQHTALFSLFGTAYGGDGRETFGLPDLRARDANGAPIPLGQVGAEMLHCVVERGYYPPRR